MPERCRSRPTTMVGKLQLLVNAAQDQRAKRIRQIEHHYPDGVAALIPQRPREYMRPVAKSFCRLADAPPGVMPELACQRRLVEDNGNSRRRIPALPGNVKQRSSLRCVRSRLPGTNKITLSNRCLIERISFSP